MPLLGATGNISEYSYRPPLVDMPGFFDWVDVYNATPGLEYRAGYAKVTRIRSLMPLRVSSGYSYSLIGNVFDNRQTVTFDNDDVNFASFDEYTDPNQRFKPGLGLDLISEYIPNNTSINLSKVLTDTSLSGYSNAYQAIVKVGARTQDWIVYTKSLNNNPTPFAFTSVNSAETNKVYQSNTITISGLLSGSFSVIQITSGTGNLYVNNINRGTSYQVQNGDTIKLEMTSSTLFNTLKTLNIKMGDYTTTWNITTEVEKLNIIFTPSDFTDQTDLNINTVFTSNQITLSGFSVNSTLPVYLTNSNSTYEVERNGSVVKSFSNNPINVTNNDKIRLQLSSSSAYTTTVETMLTVGITTANWKLTTRDIPPPSTVSFILTRDSIFDNQIIFLSKNLNSSLIFGPIPNGTSQTVTFNIDPYDTFYVRKTSTDNTRDIKIVSDQIIGIEDSVFNSSDYTDLVIVANSGYFYSFVESGITYIGYKLLTL